MSIRLLRSSLRVPALCVVFACATAIRAAAQDVRLQIEKDVWIPFLAASDAFDADGFLAAQSKDLVRVSLDAKQVYGLARYQTEIHEGFARARARGIVRRSDVRFLERMASGDLAYETGYFRSEVRSPDGSVRVRYSRFEFVLRNESGRWKILLDKDTTDGGTITEEAYQAASPLRRADVKR
jgi:ketosteroid isomerase-like protein